MSCQLPYPASQSFNWLQSLTQHNQLFIKFLSMPLLHTQEFQVETLAIPPVLIGMVDLPPCWHRQAIQIHPQLLVDVLLVPGPWHSDCPVPTSQVLRKRISNHVQGNIVNQTSVQHDPANMHPPSNLWGSSPLKGGVHPNLHCHCQPPSWQLQITAITQLHSQFFST